MEGQTISFEITQEQKIILCQAMDINPNGVSDEFVRTLLTRLILKQRKVW